MNSISKTLQKHSEKHAAFYYFALSFIALFFSLSPITAYAQTQSLKLYYTHTREKAEIVFKRDGKYDQDGLKKLNYFLRDWRRNEPTKMDPRLFDLLWTVYQLSGSKDYINVVSAYRSPATNSMLRSKSASSGVAKSSQHMLGRAMDFYLPDVNLSKLRAIGMQQEAGGVGYYPKSGSPFVHLDVGSVRHWPRMSRKELMALFPDGKTMYIPSDGKALPGYAQAKANYQARDGAPIMMASIDNAPEKKGGFFSNLFGRKNNNNDNDVEEKQPIMVAKTKPTPSLENDIASLELPNSDAPLPVTSPLLRDTVIASIIENEEEDDYLDNYLDNADSESFTLADANIPIPTSKPENASNTTLAVNDGLTTPLPQTEPVQSDTPNQNTIALASLDNADLAPLEKVKTLRERANEIDYKDNSLAGLIASNRYVPIPDDDNYYDEEEDNAEMAMIDGTKTADKVERPEQDNIANLIKENNIQPKQDLNPDQELRKIPDIIYVSGLVKQDEIYKPSKLQGRAIEFHPITRINNTY